MNGTHGGFRDLQTRATSHPDLFRVLVGLGLNIEIGKRPMKPVILESKAAAACGQPLLMNPIVRLRMNIKHFDVAQMLWGPRRQKTSRF